MIKGKKSVVAYLLFAASAISLLVACKHNNYISAINPGDSHQYKISNTFFQFIKKPFTGQTALSSPVSAIDTAKFSPITIAAFKNAKKLRRRYDTVPWFDHVNGRTYFYVVKGKINPYSLNYTNANGISGYKVGLVDPALKEILPPVYDLIHNIGGTIKGLVEVENGFKKGMIDLSGKIIVPVIYDRIYPLQNNPGQLALLLNGSDYFLLNADLTISPKIEDFNIIDWLPQIKGCDKGFRLSDKTMPDVMEQNSREEYTTMVFPPSYLVDWDIAPRSIELQNRFRKTPEGDGAWGSSSFEVRAQKGKDADNSWFSAVYHSIADNYLGARAGIELKHVLIADKKQNKFFGFSAQTYYGGAEGGGDLSGLCNENTMRIIGDNLIEFKTTSDLDDHRWNPYVKEGPYYHYLRLLNGQLLALPHPRMFEFTRYVKIDDSYLNACYVFEPKTAGHMSTEMLQYAKNEIYAEYGYKFKVPKWKNLFADKFDRAGKKLKDNVEDSLTDIEKYNVVWLDQKIKAAQKQSTKAKK